MATRKGNVNADSGYWEEAFFNAYKTGYTAILQENNDAYAGLTDVDSIQGENKAYDFVGSIEMTKKDSRFEDLPEEDIDHNRRWIFPEYYRKRVFVDDEDQIALHTDPTSSYISALGMGIIRTKNDVINNAFFSNVKGGPNPGDDTYTFNDAVFSAASEGGRTIVHDAKRNYAVGGTSTGLTIEKLILAREALINLKNNPNEVFNIACNPRQISDLLRSAETQSIDTAIIRSLQAGTVTEYMGFRFVIDFNITIGSSNDIDADTNIFEVPCWSRTGILFAQHASPIFKIDWHVDKQVWQIAARSGMNAIRMDEDRVLKIECASINS